MARGSFSAFTIFRHGSGALWHRIVSYVFLAASIYSIFYSLLSVPVLLNKPIDAVQLRNTVVAILTLTIIYPIYRIGRVITP